MILPETLGKKSLQRVGIPPASALDSLPRPAPLARTAWVGGSGAHLLLQQRKADTQ